jgi:phospholipid/cholesterol/gamma-HCH transport system substrate-binding protein
MTLSPEAKVGLLVIFVGILAAATGLFLTDMLGNWGAYYVTIQFANVQGLESGAQVRLGGVRIGRVAEVSLEPHKDFPGQPAAVRVKIIRDMALYDNDAFEIKQGAVVGDKYVAVLRKEKQTPRKRLEGGAVVAGGGASSAEVIMDETHDLISSARIAIDSIRAVAADQQTQQDLRDTISNLNKATARAIIIAEETIQLASTLNRAGQTSEARVAELMDHLVGAAASVETMAERTDKMMELSPVPSQLATASENIRQATEDVAAIIAETRQSMDDEDVQGQLAEAVANLRDASENVRVTTENISELTGDEEMTASIRETMTNVREASASLRHAAESAEGLITDEQTHEDLRATIGNVRDVSEESKSAMERAGGVMDDLEHTLDRVRQTQSMFSDVEAIPVVQMRAAADAGLRADIHTDIRLSERSRDYWRLGMRDVGDSEMLDLLWSHPLGRDMFRAGVIGSDLGIAYERAWGGNRAVEAQLYDPDDLRLDLGTRWGLWRDYHLLLGVERIGENNDPYIGVRFQRAR